MGISSFLGEKPVSIGTLTQNTAPNKPLLGALHAEQRRTRRGKRTKYGRLPAWASKGRPKLGSKVGNPIPTFPEQTNTGDGTTEPRATARAATNAPMPEHQATDASLVLYLRASGGVVVNTPALHMSQDWLCRPHCSNYMQARTTQQGTANREKRRTPGERFYYPVFLFLTLFFFAGEKIVAFAPVAEHRHQTSSSKWYTDSSILFRMVSLPIRIKIPKSRKKKEKEDRRR